MSSDTCPYCGDGLDSSGTLNHIECVRDLMGRLSDAANGRCLASDPVCEGGDGDCHDACGLAQLRRRETKSEDS